MPQDTDVARMAAALKTPSIRYRNFGNEAVRGTAVARPRDANPASDTLEDALGGIDRLLPDFVLPEGTDGGERDDPLSVLGAAKLTPAARPVVAAPRPIPTEPPRPRAPTAAPAGGGLLQALLGAASSPPPPPPPTPPRPGTGSSLLDILLGQGAEAKSDPGEYPLLHALGGAMQDLPGARPHLRPSARVETPLPELLRRVAAVARRAA